MTRYDHLPIWKDATRLTVLQEVGWPAASAQSRFTHIRIGARNAS
jgi:hypothetical protein